AHDAHATHDAHGSHGAPHDAPPAMAIPLVVLALGSIVAGYIGVPHALGGHNWIHGFLDPVFHVGGTVAAEAHGDTTTELMLMGLSVFAAFAGIALAAFLFLKRPRKANLNPTGVHKLLENKYYVDEIYDALVVRPIHALSTAVLWKGIDARLIDGAVNGTGAVIRVGSSGLRRLQTGSVRAYAMAVFLGVVAMVGYYLWR